MNLSKSRWTTSTNDCIMDPLHPTWSHLVPSEPGLHVTVQVDQLTTAKLVTVDLPDSTNFPSTVSSQECILYLDQCYIQAGSV